MIVDTVLFKDELDMLECRLVELETVPNLVHVVVEADRTYGSNEPREYVYPDHAERFAAWSDRIIHVRATDLPTGPDPWTREWAHREWAAVGLAQLDLTATDIILHSDIDEIPTGTVARNVRPRRTAVLLQRFHPFAVDWRHPDWWPGTTATTVANMPSSFAGLRDLRFSATERLPDAGWHFSWVTATVANKTDKFATFCHQEIRATWEPHAADCWETGLHVDGIPLIPVDVDGGWPRWIRDGHAPPGWYRPRHSTKPRPVVMPAPIVVPELQVGELDG